MLRESAFHNVTQQCPVCIDNTMLFWIIGIIGFWAGCMAMTLILRKPKVVYIEKEEEDNQILPEIFGDEKEE